MHLKEVHEQLSKRIAAVDFEQLWKGFSPTKFAVYTENEMCLNGEMLPKTDEFLGNTAISFEGETVAIWKMEGAYDLDVLASNIIHEMFHAFQRKSANLPYPNEIEALFHYRYTAENLSLKHLENVLLAELMLKFDREKFARFCALRKRRLNHAPLETKYEMGVELVEGSANYVELCTLEQLSKQKYESKFLKTLAMLRSTEGLFPVRILSYAVGGMLVKVMKDNGLGEPSLHAYFLQEYVDRTSELAKIEMNEAVSKQVDAYYMETRAMMKAAVLKNDQIAVKNGKLVGVNVYNARYLDGFLLTSFFLAYDSDGKTQVLYGDFAVETDPDGTIKRIYRTELEL